MRFVFASDTHSLHGALHVPDGDVFVHCGDFTMNGALGDVAAFGRWAADLPHPVKIVLAGNHDLSFERDARRAREALLGHAAGCTYLEDAEISVAGLKLYGSPWQPWFYDWAFNLRRGEPIAAKWRSIPDDVDVLVTHGPPLGILDRVGGGHVGCADLLERVRAIGPLVHAFGHIHEGSGIERHAPTTFINASICDAAYRPANPCRVVDIAVANRAVLIA